MDNESIPSTLELTGLPPTAPVRSMAMWPPGALPPTRSWLPIARGGASTTARLPWRGENALRVRRTCARDSATGRCRISPPARAGCLTQVPDRRDGARRHAPYPVTSSNTFDIRTRRFRTVPRARGDRRSSGQPCSHSPSGGRPSGAYARYQPAMRTQEFGDLCRSLLRAVRAANQRRCESVLTCCLVYGQYSPKGSFLCHRLM